MTLVYVLASLALFVALEQVVSDTRTRAPIRYDTFRSLLTEGALESVALGPEEVNGQLKEPRALMTVGGAELETAHFTAIRVHQDRDLVPDLVAGHVQIKGQADHSALTQIFAWGVLLLLMLGGWFLILKRLSPQRQVMSFGRSRARALEGHELDVTFADIAGIEEAKEELRELVLFLKDSARYERLGARIPRGILLVGSPGTGKTLMAKAVAGEASVPFFNLAGSDFVEMFAGVGASRVRDLFTQAKSNAPCMIFIDELDAIGKVRGIGHSGAHDEREQTLNMLLSEMDGFEGTQGVIILAATNRPEILDPALLRAGRFDRQVIVDRPDLKGRRAILEVHAAKVKLGEDVDLDELARTTPGFVGADLANLCNEAALLAARRELDAVSMKDFDDALQRSVAGLEKRGRVMRADEKRRIAYHETGHALVALAGAHTDPVHRVSIVSRGVAALGYTMQMPAEERYVLTEAELTERIEVMLGGRVAERVCFGDVSTGAADDLRRAVSLARRMVTEFGMSARIGPVAFAPDRDQRFLDGAGAGRGRGDYSEETAREIDGEIRRIVGEAEERVKESLCERRESLDHIAEALIREETLDRKELLRVALESGARPHPSKLDGYEATRPASPAD